MKSLARAKDWRSAPTVRTVSPDGKLYVCYVIEIDGSGRTVHQVWRLKLGQPDAAWELLHQTTPGSGS